VSDSLNTNEKYAPLIGIAGIVGAVVLAVLHLIPGTAAVAAISTICLKTDASKILGFLKGKSDEQSSK